MPSIWIAITLLAYAGSAAAAPSQLTAQAGSPAHAPLLTNEARAEQLFSSAEKKFDSGDYAGACADFSESLKLGPKLGTLLNLALCHETTGQVVTAWHEFSHAAAWAAQNNQRDRLEFATRHVRALEAKLPRVVIQLPPECAIGGIDLDGEPLPEDRWYLPLFLDPGEHRLAVTAPGKQRATIAFRVTTSPSDQLVYVPSLADAPIVTPAEAPVTTTEKAREPRTLGWIGLGLGAAGIAAGATFGVFAMTATDGDSTVKRDATISTLAFLSGGAFAAVGTWILVSGPSGQRTTAVSIAPHRSGLGLSASAAF